MNALNVGIVINRENAQVARRRFIAVAALVFMTGVFATYAIHASMSSMNDMPMPGGWMLSRAFTPMCGRTWLRAAASFIGMWIAMMTAMMLPSFAPLLWRYRAMHEGAGATRATRHSLAMATGYFAVWTALGVAVFALGALFSEIVMRVPCVARCVPFAGGTVVLLAGALQFSRWHVRGLACCRGAAHRVDVRFAWRDGLRHGLHCVMCCAGLTATLFVFGTMDPRAMALVTLAISAERLLPASAHATRIIGVVLVLLGSIAIIDSTMH